MDQFEWRRLHSKQMTSMGASELLVVSSYHEFAHELAHEAEAWCWVLANAPRQCGCAVTAEATPPSTWLRRCAALRNIKGYSPVYS